MESQEVNKKDYTEKDEHTLTNRLQSLITLSIITPNDTYPIKLNCLGYGLLYIESSIELRYRAKELMEILRLESIEINIGKGDILIRKEDL